MCGQSELGSSSRVNLLLEIPVRSDGLDEIQRPSGDNQRNKYVVVAFSPTLNWLLDDLEASSEISNRLSDILLYADDED